MSLKRLVSTSRGGESEAKTSVLFTIEPSGLIQLRQPFSEPRLCRFFPT